MQYSRFYIFRLIRSNFNPNCAGFCIFIRNECVSVIGVDEEEGGDKSVSLITVPLSRY